MISLHALRGRAALVVGLGKSGRSAARALQSAGAVVSVWDDNTDAREQARADGYTIFDAARGDFAALDDVIWSPGVPHTHPAPHPLAEKAKAVGLTLRCDVDLLAEARPAAQYVGITGTNGKSTTTALTAHILKAAGKRIEVGGNLGFTALDLAPLDADGIYVLELSSYQTELTPHLSCRTAVLINISPDHLDRHGGLDGYIAAKKQMLEHQPDGATAVVGIDDTYCQAVADDLMGEKRLHLVRMSSGGRVSGGVGVQDGFLQDDAFGSGEQIDLRGLATLPGQHNWQNATAAYAVARDLDIPATTIAEAFRTFPGLAHRQETVGAFKNVTFVNDSKATNADAASNALRCYGCVYWIAGGVPKAGGITTLGPLFGRIRHAYLIGDAVPDFADVLRRHGVAHTTYDNLEAAVAAAGSQALADDIANATVLLSPACASFDMFSNFEERGDAFRRAVQSTWPEARL
jgi:UDP-N-acetylmuramoylalanine--D-glutamate ligase